MKNTKQLVYRFILPCFARAVHTDSVPITSLPALIAKPSIPIRRVFFLLSNRQFLFHFLIQLLRDGNAKRGFDAS